MVAEAANRRPGAAGTARGLIEEVCVSDPGEKKSRPQALSDRDKAAIQELLDKAADDIELREALLRDPELVLNPAVDRLRAKGPQVPLSPAALTLLFSLRRVALEEAGIDVRASRVFLRDNGTSSSSRAE